MAEAPEPFKTQELGEGEFWGVFDGSDLDAPLLPNLPESVTAALAPVPTALFENAEEARGYVLLMGGWLHRPAIRLCKVRGTVTVDVAPNEDERVRVPMVGKLVLP